MGLQSIRHALKNGKCTYEPHKGLIMKNGLLEAAVPRGVATLSIQKLLCPLTVFMTEDLLKRMMGTKQFACKIC